MTSGGIVVRVVDGSDAGGGIGTSEVVVIGTIVIGTELVGIVPCVVVTKDVDVVGGNSVVVVVEDDG